jgi:prepilin-type N-terminal cleavage/methylation domain-containing protein
MWFFRKTYRARFKRRQDGFTLAELLISIAIISVALLGTLSSLAFGIKASDSSADQTQALNLDRRMLELILVGGTKGPVITLSSSNVATYNFTGAPWNNPGTAAGFGPAPGPTDARWVPLSSILANTAPPFASTDFLNALDTMDTTRINVAAQLFKIRITAGAHVFGSGAVQTGIATTPNNYLTDVQVDVGWWEKTFWKTVTTSSIYRFRSTF